MIPEIHFRFLKIDIMQFAMIEEAFKEIKFEIKTNLQMELLPEIKALRVVPTIHFIQGTAPFIILQTENIFSLDSKSWERLLNKNILKMPKGFLQHVSFLSIGAMRGILHVKTEKTRFNHIVLPTININEIVNDDVAFQIEQVAKQQD